MHHILNECLIISCGRHRSPTPTVCKSQDLVTFLMEFPRRASVFNEATLSTIYRTSSNEMVNNRFSYYYTVSILLVGIKHTCCNIPIKGTFSNKRTPYSLKPGGVRFLYTSVRLSILKTHPSVRHGGTEKWTLL